MRSATLNEFVCRLIAANQSGENVTRPEQVIDESVAAQSVSSVTSQENTPLDITPTDRITDTPHLSTRSRVLIVFTFFSMFFGAGNLIFPPFVGAQAGASTPLATVGFIVSAVGLPILGVIAVSMAGGFEQLAKRVSKRFSIVLGTIIILTIGPFFAIPRTATTSFETAIIPFAGDTPRWVLQLAYSLVFFTFSFLVAQHPEGLSKTIGRFMGPILIVLIAVLFVSAVVMKHPALPAPSGNYAHGLIPRGFLDGYQTMDLLAALYFGIVISANLRTMGVTDESRNRQETAKAGLGAGILLVVIYASLAFVGAVSSSLAPIDAGRDTGAAVLTNLTTSAFGPLGTLLLGLIFVIACFNVCTGLISTCSSYFQNQFPVVAGRRITYRAWSIIFTVFSFVVSNAGLAVIIKVSIPVLSALYPISIVLVALSLLHRVFSSKFPRVYFWTVLCVGVVSICECVNSLVMTFGGMLPWLNAALKTLPFASAQLSWLLPAALGLIIGIADSLIRRQSHTDTVAEV